MAESFSNYKKRTYLYINQDGHLYTKVSENDQGRVEVKLKDGRIVYHKLFSRTDKGRITRINITEDLGFGKSFQIQVESEETQDIISVPLLTQQGYLNQYVREFAKILPNIDFSKEVTITPSTKKNDKGFVYKSLFVNVDGDFVRYAIGKEDLPEVVKKEKLGGGVTYDTEDLDKFLLDVIKKHTVRLVNYLESDTINRDASDEAPVQKAGDVKNTQPDSSKETEEDFHPEEYTADFDDLPF